MNGLATHRLLLFAVLTAGLTVPALAARAEEPKATVQGVADEDLRDLIQTAIGTAERPAGSRFEARRRGREAAESATAVLRSEGFYASEVASDLADRDEEGESEAAPRAVVTVTQGPQFRIKRPSISWENVPPAPEVQSAA